MNASAVSLLTFPQQMGAGGTITGSDVPFRPSPQPSYGGFGQTEEEPEPMRYDLNIFPEIIFHLI